MLRVYRHLLLAGMRRQSAYRMAVVGGLVANVTFGFLKVAVLFATVRAAGGSVKGYDLGLMSSYIWLSQGLLGSVNLFGASDMATRVKTGDVAVDFLRPLDPHTATVVTDLGRALFTLLPRGVPQLLIGALVVGMHLPQGPTPYLLGLVSVLLGITLSLAVVYLIAVAGFWLVETRGLQLAYMVLAGFFAGLFVPLPLFPGWLQRVTDFTPFPSMLMAPVNVLSGYLGGWHAAGTVALQAGWLVLALAVGQILTRRGRRHLEVQGG